jgi:hypothetical protein
MNHHPDQIMAGSKEDEGQGPSRRWTLLFIGDHGKVISFKHIKLLFISTLALLVMSVAAIAVLAYINQQLQTRTRELRLQLEASRQSIQALREARDMLTAHVVLAETKIKEIIAGTRPSTPDKKPEPRADSEPPEKSAAAEAKTTEPSAGPPPNQKDDQPAMGIGDVVAIEGFRIKINSDRNTFDLQYKVVNTSQEHKPVSGHVILVLKGDNIDPGQWLAIPRVDLPQGRPSGRQKGYTFSIRHSKTITQSMPAPKVVPAFTKAVLYVFSNEGQLLFANDYAVHIQPSGG